MKKSAGVEEIKDVVERFRTQGYTTQVHREKKSTANQPKVLVLYIFKTLFSNDPPIEECLVQFTKVPIIAGLIKNNTLLMVFTVESYIFLILVSL